jgi:hypothetical protein
METAVKTKRIKKVFSNAGEVIHRWANQSQSDARCRNAFFNGKNLYSYGHHYHLGMLFNYRGVQVAMINDTGYSVTTSGHISSAWHAVEGQIRLKFSIASSQTLGPDLIEPALIAWQDRLLTEIFDFFGRRTFYKGYLDSDYDVFEHETEEIAEFNRACAALGFKKLMLEVPSEIETLRAEHVALRLARAEELEGPREAERVKRAEAALKKVANSIEDWKSGGPSVEALLNLSPQIIRIHGDRVETSRGASVSLVVAQKLLQRVLNGEAKPGEDVGPYHFDKLDGDTVKIGCHTFSVSQCRDILAANRTLSIVEDRSA